MFLFAWAVSARESGWPGFWEVALFIGILVAALVYLWRIGALDWGTVRRHTEEHRKELHGNYDFPAYGP